MSTYGIGSGLGTAAELSGALASGAGSVGSGALGAASYITPELMGPTYGELGITGVEGGFAGPTYGEMGFTGLNQSEAIAAANAASKGMSTSDILSNINRARNATNTLSKLVKNPADSTSGSTGGTSGINTQQLASLLGSGLPTQSAPGGLYRMNENPFIFGNQGQSVIPKGTYDVSGTNPMANALRKRS
jgi:hypothetical protein